MINAVEIQTDAIKYEVEYTWDRGEDYSLCIDPDQTRFGFKYVNGRLSHSTRPEGYGQNLMNDIMQRIYDIESAKSDYVDELWFYCYIRRLEVKND